MSEERQHVKKRPQVLIEMKIKGGEGHSNPKSLSEDGRLIGEDKCQPQTDAAAAR